MFEDKTVSELTFDDIKDYIAFQGFTGNNSTINPDGSRDMRTYLSQDKPFESTLISTIPSQNTNDNPTFNAACLVIGGDAAQSTSTSEGYYISTSTEVLFSIAIFDPITKSETDNFVCIWYIRLDTTNS